MKRRQVIRQNIIELVLTLLIVVCISIISSFVYTRFDLTAEKRYTLSDETKKLLSNIDDIIYVKVYLEGDLPSGFRRLKDATKELLDEFRIYSDYLEYEFIDPSESSDAKTRNDIYRELHKKGIIPTPLEVKDETGKISNQVIFPGALIRFRGREIALDLLSNKQDVSTEQSLNSCIENLEYGFTNTIRKLNTKMQQSVAFIEGHGEFDFYHVADITKTLMEYYIVKRVRIDGDMNSLKDYNAIIIAGPDSAFTEGDKFIIDQFIMKGGKALWLVDAVKVSWDSLESSRSTVALMNRTNLDDQLFKYGVRINPDLIQDFQCAMIPMNTAFAGAPPQFKPHPWYYFPVILPKQKHPIVKNLDILKAEFVSTVDTVGNDPDIKKTFLLYSSNYSKVVRAPARIGLELAIQKPGPKYFSKPRQPIAVLLEGKFKSVFTNRILPVSRKGQEIETYDISKPTKMIVVSDGDIIKNYVINTDGEPYPYPLGADRWYKQAFYGGNKQFLLNAVNYLCDDSGLMSLRAREIKLRLLNKQKIFEQRTKWQIINTLIPVLFIIIFGLVIMMVRKRRYC